MDTINIGDYVSFIDTDGGGIVKRICGDVLYVDWEGFETPVHVNDCIAIPFERRYVNPRTKPGEDPYTKGLKAKIAVDSPRRKTAPAPKSKPETIEVDLHIHNLVDTTAGMNNTDIITCQLDEFRRVMDANLRNQGQKIVFIHGKGEGVLRQAILKELNARYKGHDVQDASFREYGFGATQVTIRRHN